MLLRGEERANLGDSMLMTADIATSYGQIRRGMYAAVDLALAIHLHTINAKDVAQYRRVIPAPLVDMRIEDVNKVNVETFYRILAVDPWVSWMERLRAQKQRTARVLREEDAAEFLAEGTQELLKTIIDLVKAKKIERELHKAERAAHKSIRKAVKTFGRLFDIKDLRTFLASDRANPLLIQGHAYDYSLTKRRGSLIRSTIHLDTGMATVGTAVFSKSGERLCDLCLYFEDTPVIDCVMATILNVRNEETELDMLRAACVMDTPRDFYEDPVLPDLKGLHDPATAPTTLVENVLAHATTLPISTHSLVRDSLRETALPMAYRAFKEINQLGKQYLPIMRMCHDFDMYEYMDGKPYATRLLKLVQRTMANGEF